MVVTYGIPIFFVLVAVVVITVFAKDCIFSRLRNRIKCLMVVLLEKIRLRKIISDGGKNRCEENHSLTFDSHFPLILKVI